MLLHNRPYPDQRNVDLRWSIADDSRSSGSDHEILDWEVVKNQGEPIHKTTTRWDLRGFQVHGRSPGGAGEEKGNPGGGEEKMGGRGGEKRRAAGRTEEGMEEDAKWIRDTAAETLDEFSKPRRVDSACDPNAVGPRRSPSSGKHWGKQDGPPD